MATILAETTWHGNPRPVEAFASTFFDAQVESPYYNDRRNVPSFAHVVTSIPYTVAGAANTTPGPAASVVFTLSGVWLVSNSLTLTIVRTTAADYGPVVFTPLVGQTAEDFAILVAASISTQADMDAVAVGAVITVTAVLPVTALTITTLTVA
jgi:hypothetical protein